MRDLMTSLGANNKQLLLCRRQLRPFFKQQNVRFAPYWPDLYVPSHPWLIRLSHDWQNFWLKLAFVRFKPNIVVVQSFSNDDIGKLQDICEKKNIPILFTALTLFAPRQKKHFEGNLPVFNRFTAILSLCEQTKKNLQRLGVNQPKLCVVHNGVDVNTFKPAVNKKLSVVWVGRVDDTDKNAHLFLEIAALAEKQNRPLKFRMVGDGPLLASLKRESLERKSANLFFSGFVQRSPQIYKDAFALCVTSSSEAIPLCIIEAMACGIPVISTDVGGISEAISSPEDGCLVKKAEAAAFVNRLEELLQNPKAWSEISETARKKIETNFNASDQYKRVEKLFRELAG